MAMFNLYQIMQDAQGGQAINNLAQQFGLTPEQADAAVKSLIPALSTGFVTKAAQPGGYGEILGTMGDDQHRQAYADPAAAQDPDVQQKGGDIVSSIFGNSGIANQIAEQASRYTGIPAATLLQMLPVIASMIVGGVATTMHNQGMGGMLGQLISMAQQGGFGSIFGQFTGGAQQPGGGQPNAPQTGSPQADGGGLGGIFGNILNSVLGGAGQGQAGGAGGGVPPMMQAGMDALNKMFQPGVQPPPGHTPDGDLGAEIGSILGGKR
jgi:hypothetical protein